MKKQSFDEAVKATDDFYKNREGFQYNWEKITSWLRQHTSVKPGFRVLDLCCGDGAWSKGFQEVEPGVECFGVDISPGAVETARKLCNSDESQFFVCDTEKELPFEDGFFDLIFARGTGLHNQHRMDRPATIKVIEMWHRKLKPETGIMNSSFYSAPDKMGTYTPLEDVKLPMNWAPRKTETLDFDGGKFHHTKASWMAPFEKAQGVEVVDYKFELNLHILDTKYLPQH